MPVLKYLALWMWRAHTVPRDLNHKTVQWALNCLCIVIHWATWSAYSNSRSLFPENSSTPPPKGLNKAFCRTCPMTKLKKGNLRYPCYTPLNTTRCGERWPYALTQPDVWLYNPLKIDTYFSGTPFLNEQWHNPDQSTGSRLREFQRTRWPSAFGK